MSEATQKMLGLVAIIISIFLLMGGLYLPDGFVVEPTQTVLVVLGVVLLLGGNVVMIVAHNDE